MNAHYTAATLIAEITDLRKQLEAAKAERKKIFRAGAVCCAALVQIRDRVFSMSGAERVANDALKKSDAIFRNGGDR